MVMPVTYLKQKKKCGVSWYGAKEFCESKGGFLADVLNQETQDFINKRTQQDYHTTDWWLGGNDIQKVLCRYLCI